MKMTAIAEQRRNRNDDIMKTSKSAKIFEKSGVGQAPSKDFFSLSVVKDMVIWRSWRITLRSNKALPSETIQSWHEFVDTSSGARLQGEIRRVFGADTLSYVICLVTQSWLLYMKSDILVEIVVRLDLLDIARLAQVCRALYNACSSEMLWRRLYVKHFGEIPSEIHSVGEEVGWKRAFFMNRLKLVNTSRKVHVVHLNEAIEDRQKVKLVTA